MKVGVEIECFVYQKNNQVFDVYEYLVSNYGKEEIELEGVGKISTDAGRHQLEVSFRPLELDLIYPGVWEDMMMRVISLFPSDCIFYFNGTDPIWRDENNNPSWSPKERYIEIVNKLQQRTGNTGVLKVSRYSSLHIHLELLENKEVSLRLINYVNNYAPILAKIFCTCQSCCTRLRECWFGWADDERRVPHPFWFDNWNDLESYIKSIPPIFDEPELHESTIWWFVRPRCQYGTLEFRMFDSNDPYEIYFIVKMLLRIIRIIKRMENNMSRYNREWWWRLVKNSEATYYDIKPVISYII